jgi:alcohol dehydrogenase class IV
MNSFRYLASELRLYQGEDALQSLGRELDRAKSCRAVIVCGKSVANHPSLLGAATQAIGGRLVGVFGKVQAHSPSSCVEAATQMLRMTQADAVIAIGGGSAMVTARAAAIALAEAKDVAELATRMEASGELSSPRLSAPKLPQFVVPTTPTTAAVKAGSAVLDESTGRRRALFDPKTRARAVFVHPLFLESAPASLVLAASINTLTMAIEGLEAPAAHALTDADFLQSIHLSEDVLGNFSENVQVSSCRSALMLAAILCGRGTDHVGGGVCSALSHACGARTGVENGLINAVLLPHVVAFNAERSRAARGESQLAQENGLRCEYSRVRDPLYLRRLFCDAGAPERLRDLEVPKLALDDIAGDAGEDWFLQRGPRPVNGVQELRTLLEQAW